MLDAKTREPEARTTKQTSSEGDPLQDPLAGETVRHTWQGGEPMNQTRGGDPDKPDPSKMLGAFQSGGLAATRTQHEAGVSRRLSTEGKLRTPTTFGTGSARVVTGVEVRGGVNDTWSVSAQYQAERALDPTADPDTLWRRAVKNDCNPGGTMVDWQPEGGARANTTGRKKAVIVVNETYQNNQLWDPLPGAGQDAKAMQATLEGDGYKVKVHKDQNSAGILGAFNAGVADAAPGDEVTLYFAGHGLKTGLVGTTSTWAGPRSYSDIAPHTSIASYATKAVSGGFHVDIIADACESEALAARVAEEGQILADGMYRQTDQIGNGYDPATDPKRAAAICKVLGGKNGVKEITDRDQLNKVLERQFKM